MHKIAKPKTCKEPRWFISMVNYYQDMLIHRLHILVPLTALTSSEVKFVWTDKEQKAFNTIKQILSKETLLAYPDFSKPFKIHTNASKVQLGAVISQNGKPIAFYLRKLSPAQTRYTTTKRKLLAIVETLKGVPKHIAWAAIDCSHRLHEPNVQALQHRTCYALEAHSWKV